MRAGRHIMLKADALKQVLEWAAKPPRQRPLTIEGMAEKFGVSANTIKRAAARQGGYAKVAL